MMPLLYLLAADATTPLRNCDFKTSTNGGAAGCDTILPQVTADNALLAHVLTLVFGVLGFLAVIFIILGGFRYIVSQGNPQANKQAWQTIMFAAIGLVIVMFAEVAVRFILGRF